MGDKVREYLPLLQEHGVEKVYLLERDIFERYSLSVYVIALQKLIVKYDPLIMMFGATSYGSELAPRIAARLKLLCITEMKRIWASGENLVIAKSCYDDKIYQNFDFRPERTVVVTVSPGDMDGEKGDRAGELEIVNETIHMEIDRTRTRTLKSIRGDPKRINLEEADLIVAGGKGIGKERTIIEDLANILGASIGGTRPLVDDGTIQFERQIGITGRSVSPKLLITCGISGAREFTAGIEKARLIIAINTDAKAPILKFAHLGAIGDLHKIIPLIIARVRNHKENTKRGQHQ
jgi:electron transfer flavoprotein alpha subunit